MRAVRVVGARSFRAGVVACSRARNPWRNGLARHDCPPSWRALSSGSGAQSDDNDAKAKTAAPPDAGAAAAGGGGGVAATAASFGDASLRGVGQVVFCNSTLSGGYILGALAWGDVRMTVCSVFDRSPAVPSSSYRARSRGTTRLRTFAGVSIVLLPSIVYHTVTLEARGSARKEKRRSRVRRSRAGVSIVLLLSLLKRERKEKRRSRVRRSRARPPTAGQSHPNQVAGPREEPTPSTNEAPTTARAVSRRSFIPAVSPPCSCCASHSRGSRRLPCSARRPRRRPPRRWRSRTASSAAG